MPKYSLFKQAISLIVIVFFIGLAVGSTSDDSPEKGETGKTPKSSSTDNSDSAGVNGSNASDALNKRLINELESFKKPFDNGAFDGSVEAIQLELVLFGSWQKLAEEAMRDAQQSNVKLAKQLNSKVARLQAKEFPIMRKRYGKVVANVMWEHDISVKTSGTGNRVLELTGVIFASNKNIKEYQSTLSEIVKQLRFTQTHYRWYEGESQYTRYNLDVPKDTEPVTFSENNGK